MSGPKEISLQDMKAGMADGSIAVVDVREANALAVLHRCRKMSEPMR